MKTTPIPTRTRRVRTTAVPVAGAVAVAVGLGTALAPPASAADTALIMGPTGVPIPPQIYIDAAEQRYLGPNGYGAYTPQAQYAPEQFYPVTGVTSLPVDTSVAQGVSLLNTAVNQQIASGNDVVVFGYSQSSVIASQYMAQLATSSTPPKPDQLSFVLVGDPSNPNGGLNPRFEVPGVPLSLSSLGEKFNVGATPGNAYPTDIYTIEYDGLGGDFPQYPIDFLSDLNAVLGMVYQHFTYLDLTPKQMSSAIPLTPTAGGTTTHYYMIPTTDLPLLDPVRLIPIIGNPLADLLQPDLTVLVNLGYGSITQGWSTTAPNMPTPLGLFPTGIKPVSVLAALAKGAVQGVTHALDDLKTPTLFDLSSLSGLFAAFNTLGLSPSSTPSLLQLLAAFSTQGNAGVPVSATGGILNTLTKVISADLAVGKPLADTALALGVSLPQYDAKLFSSQLAAGHLLNAIGMPIAADLGLAPYALLVGAVFPLVEAVATTVTRLAELAGLEPNPAAATAGAGSGPGGNITNGGVSSAAATGSPIKPSPIAAVLHNTKKTAKTAVSGLGGTKKTAAPVTAALGHKK